MFLDFVGIPRGKLYHHLGNMMFSGTFFSKHQLGGCFKGFLCFIWGKMIQFQMGWKPSPWICDSKDLDLLLSELPLDADGQLSFFQLMFLVFPKEIRTSPFRFGWKSTRQEDTRSKDYQWKLLIQSTCSSHVFMFHDNAVLKQLFAVKSSILIFLIHWVKSRADRRFVWS